MGTSGPISSRSGGTSIQALRPEVRELLVLIDAYAQTQADIEVASIEEDLLEVTELKHKARSMYQDIIGLLLVR